MRGDAQPAPGMSTPARKAEAPQRGIQSIEVGGQLLQALAHQGRPMALKDLAAAAGMAAARAHPYLVSLGKVGLVEQERASGRYGLGPLALQLGLMSLQQIDPVRLATPLLDDLAQHTGHTIALAVWGSRGPTIVLLAESPAAVHVNMRLGTVFSIAGTASGQLFAALLPADQVRPLYEAERQTRALPTWAAFQKTTLTEVRHQGLGRSDGAVVAGVSAMSAPVFDHRGQVVLAITAIGPSAALDLGADGAPARLLREAAASVSTRLGHRRETTATAATNAPPLNGNKP